MQRLFSLEEMNIIEMYSGKTKAILIQNIRFATPYMEKRFRIMAKRIIEKLSLLSEEEFQTMERFTAFE